MAFSRAVIPLMRLNCWKMKPKVFRRISVRKRSGRLVISVSRSRILPAVGLAMQPMRLRSVVFPDPLGPFKAVALWASMDRLIPCTATNSFGFPELKTFLTSLNSIMVRLSPHHRIGVHDRGPPGGNDRGHR